MKNNELLYFAAVGLAFTEMGWPYLEIKMAQSGEFRKSYGAKLARRDFFFMTI